MSAPITVESLASIRVLYRRSFTMCIWGIPYNMRRDVLQSPRHLWEAGNTSGWIWLGKEGWFGSMSKEQQALVREFLERHKDSIPGWPEEWAELPSV